MLPQAWETMRISIRKRLSGFMLAMIVPIVVIGAVSFSLIQEVVERFEAALAEAEGEILPAIYLQSLINRAIMPPNDYLATGDRQEIVRFSEAAAMVDSEFDRLTKRSFDRQEEKGLVQEALGFWLASRQTAAILLGISEPVGNQEAARLMALMDFQAMQATKSLGTIFSVAQEERKEELRKANEAYRRMIRWVVFFGAAGMFAGIVLVFLLDRHLTRPIRTLTEGAVRIGGGHLDHRIEVGSGDELGVLAEEFNRMAVILHENQETLKHLAMHDGMTGLLNHKEFHRRLSEEFSRAERHQRPLTLMMIDIDHFKKFNDTYGHPQGDKLLKLISEAIKESVRQSDIVARYGGEEFAVLVVETALPEATALGWRIQKRIHDLGSEMVRLITNADGAPVTVSVGAASYPNDAATAGDLVQLADQMLYRAKKKGRNQVCTTAQDGSPRE